MEKTAVDWMATEIIEAIQHGDKDFVYWKLKTVILEQAKELEKQQIVDAYRVGKVEATLPSEKLTTGGKYYRELFKPE
jgi:hypothetical protein